MQTATLEEGSRDQNEAAERVRRGMLLAALLAAVGLLGGCSSCGPEPGEEFEPKADSTAGDGSPASSDAETDAMNNADRPGWNTESIAGGAPEKIDLLWVLDNTGSMCQEQAALRQNFRRFMEGLTDDPIDFQISVTTTHNIYADEAPERDGVPYDRHLFGPDQKPDEDARGAPIAEAGQIQSSPNPALPPTEDCHFASDNGTLDRSDITPIKQQLDQAVKCTQEPGDYQVFGDNNNFEQLAKCAVIDEPFSNDEHQFCENAGKQDEYSVRDLVAEIFPCGQELGKACEDESEFARVYRDIPKVLRKSDYAGEDDTLDEQEIERLKEDFACMSFVGGGGDPFEQGLRNAALAVHPLMTGGPKGEPFSGASFEHPVTGEQVEVSDGTDRPNHGFLRKDATTAVVFVTDENDCSHEGHKMQERLQENLCGEVNCYFPTEEGSDRADDLIGTSTLYEDFVEGLKRSRRLDELEADDLIVASIHGDPHPYNSPQHPQSDQHVVPQTCGQDGAPTQPELIDSLTVCSSSLGAAKSGDRYADFLANVEGDGHTVYPERARESQGPLCSGGSLEGPLDKISKRTRSRLSGCLSERVLPCADDSGCPAFDDVYESTEGPVCQQWGDGSQEPAGFCASAIQVKMRPESGASFDELEASDRNVAEQFCIGSTLDDGSASCTIKRSAYEWARCPGVAHSMSLEWSALGTNQDPDRVFGGFVVEAVYETAEEN